MSLSESEYLEAAFGAAIAGNCVAFREIIRNDRQGYGLEVQKADKSLLYVACEHGHADFVKMLLDLGANANHICGKKGDAALHVAVRERHGNVIEKLLSKSAVNVNIENKATETALMLAAGRGEEGIAKALLGRRANVEARDKNGDTALAWAACNGFRSVVECLVEEHHADVDSVNKHNESALMLAATNNHVDVVSTLLDLEANLDLSDEDGRSALIIAAQWGSTEVVSLLLDHEATIDYCDMDGNSALIAAVQNRHQDTVKLLLEEGAAVDLCNCCQASALMTAAWLGSVAMVQLLLNFNADPALQNSEGMNAADLCRSKSSKIITGLLADEEYHPFERTVRVFKGGKHHAPKRVGPKRSKQTDPSAPDAPPHSPQPVNGIDDAAPVHLAVEGNGLDSGEDVELCANATVTLQVLSNRPAEAQQAPLAAITDRDLQDAHVLLAAALDIVAAPAPYPPLRGQQTASTAPPVPQATPPAVHAAQAPPVPKVTAPAVHSTPAQPVPKVTAPAVHSTPAQPVPKVTEPAVHAALAPQANQFVFKTAPLSVHSAQAPHANPSTAPPAVCAAQKPPGYKVTAPPVRAALAPQANPFVFKTAPLSVHSAPAPHVNQSDAASLPVGSRYWLTERLQEVRMTPDLVQRCEDKLVHQEGFTSQQIFATVSPNKFNEAYLERLDIKGLGIQQLLLSLHREARKQFAHCDGDRGDGPPAKRRKGNEGCAVSSDGSKDD